MTDSSHRRGKTEPGSARPRPAPSTQPELSLAAPPSAHSSPRTVALDGPVMLDASPADSDGYCHAALATAGIPVVGLDLAGGVVLWNHAAGRLFGKSHDEILHQPFETLIPHEYRVLAHRALARTRTQRSVNAYEVAFVPPGGTKPRHLHITLSCVHNAGGQTIGIMAWLSDVTASKNLEHTLTRTRHMASVGTLAAGVAHHFNNIICGMSTMVEMALSTEDPVMMHRALKMSAEAAGRVGYITQSLLAMAAPESGEPDQADLTEELLRFVDAVEPSLARQGIHLKLDLQAQHVAAVPRHRFSQALHHLLKNSEEAFAACPPGQPRHITIRTQSQGPQVLLTFADTGGGIAPGNLAHVFDPFFTTKGVHAGGNESNPGLGLTLVHSLAIDLGGHAWVASGPGRGTTISLLIPTA